MKTGQIAQKLGLRVKTLQRWDREGLLKPKRTTTNQREYDDADVIKALKILSPRRYVLITHGKISKGDIVTIDLSAMQIVSLDAISSNGRLQWKENSTDQAKTRLGIGRLLQAERTRNKLSLKGMARKLGWTTSWVSQVEAMGNADLTLGSVLHYLKALHLALTVKLTANGVMVMNVLPDEDTPRRPARRSVHRASTR